MKIYIKRTKIRGAWDWIQNGYANAWKQMDFEVLYYDLIEDIYDTGEYDIMIRDWDINSDRDLRAIESARRVYFFNQPNSFPMPWGSHPNFMTKCSDEFIEKINSLDNVFLWNWGELDDKRKQEYFPKWKKMHLIPMAFDYVNYIPKYDEKYNFDVCYIGGWADNGFNEKRSIMLKQFAAFKDSNLKCGFFINKSLTHEQENAILYSSKVCINIHDKYQRVLGLDTNERTYKALGLTGVLVNDNGAKLQMGRMFPDVLNSSTPEEMVKFVKDHVNMDSKELQLIKEKNRQMILENHTYVNRVKTMMEL